MRKLYLLKTILLLCALVVGSGNVWAASETVTYTFKSKSWTATLGGEDANWTSGIDGAGFGNNGVQVTTGSTGANATSPVSYSDISKIVVTYNTNKTAGAGSLDIKIGDNEKTTKTCAYSGSGDGRTANYTLEYDYDTPQSGSVKITANTTTNSIYVVSIAITYTADSRADAGLAYDPKSVTLELDEAFTAPTFSNPNELAVSYSSDNDAVATVNATTGAINFVGGLGTAVITATSDESSTYKAGLATFTINVVRKTPTLTVADDFGMKTGESVTIDDDIYLTDADGTVNVTSGSPSVVSVAEGKLNALTTGSAVITVNVAQGETYAATSETFTITVTANPAVAPEGEALGSGYSLVTDASTLADGDKILIVNSKSNGTGKAMSTNQKSSNRGVLPVTIEDGVIASISDNDKDYDVQVITLEGSTDQWYFNVGTGYLYASSSGSNELKTNNIATTGDNAKAKITINSGVASIVFQGTNTRNVMQYNSSSSLFSCYASASQSAVYIYRQNVATSYDITMGAAGWRTLVSALDVTLPEGLTAYTAKVSGDKAVLTQVTEIAKNQPYLLSGAAGTYTLTKASSDVTAPTDNDLAISDATTGNGVFVLAKRNNVVGFYKWNGGYIGAGRVYLPASAGAREFIGFDDETAGVESSQFTVHSSQLIYDLQGRRVSSQCTVNNSQLKKGLYIVNGKKVIVK